MNGEYLRKSNNPVTPIISIRKLSFRYYDTPLNVLDNVELQIKAGEIVVIAGRSGSGKSTLLRAINGLIPHQHAGDYSGSVFVDGLEVQSVKMSELATKVGYIFQNPENQIFMFSVERDIAFGLENFAIPTADIRKKVDWALDVLKIKGLSLTAPHELSDGQKQRVAIAGAIVMGQKILIFDEPTSLLDPFTARSLIEFIKKLHDELGITILIVEHRLDLVSRIANRLIVLDEGRIVYDGDPRRVMYSSNLSVYGVTEPTIVRTGKLLNLDGFISRESFPVSADELVADLRGYEPSRQ
ncbi:MAG: ABC transporter ATP-binding protein [archaeon]|nr:ABC transporter ATP-binding protein [archaeon]